MSHGLDNILSQFGTQHEIVVMAELKSILLNVADKLTVLDNIDIKQSLNLIQTELRENNEKIILIT